MTLWPLREAPKSEVHHRTGSLTEMTTTTTTTTVPALLAVSLSNPE
jgi:hypothetical protein